MRMLTKKDFEGHVFKNINSRWDVLLDVGAVALRDFEEEIPIRHPLISEKKKVTIAAAAATRSSSNFFKEGFVPPPPPTREEKKKGVLVSDNKDAAKQSRCRCRCDYDLGLEKFSKMNCSTTSTLKRSRNPKSLADQECDGNDTDREELMKIKKREMKKRNMKLVRPNPDQRPDLPERFRQKINELNGRDITLVIQKPLFSTDVSPDHDRLSIPFAQIITWDNFLTPDEKALLSRKETMEVPIIDPKLDQGTSLILKQWEMKSGSLYALRSQWYGVVVDNNLKEGQELQVWSFRVGNRLHIALVAIKDKGKQLALDDEPLLGMPSSSGTAGASSSGAGGSGSTD